MNEHDLACCVQRDKLLDLTQFQLLKVKSIIDDLLVGAKTTAADVEEVVVTGGMSKMNEFRFFLETIFKKDNIKVVEDAVIRGLALVADDEFIGKKKDPAMVLINSTAYATGIEM